MNKWLANIDLQRPLTDNPFWNSVKGVWIPLSQLRIGTACSKLYDLSPHKNYAIQNNSSYQPIWEDVKQGFSLKFDGSDDTLQIADKTWMSPSVTESLSLGIIWMPSVYDDMDIYGRNNGSWSVSKWTANIYTYGHSKNIAWGIGNGASFYAYDAAAHPFVVGKVYNLILSINNSNISFFVNGSQQSAKTRSFTLANTTNPLRIGGEYEYTNGYIFLVFAFARGITNSEALFFYEQSLKGYPDLIRRRSIIKYFLPIVTTTGTQKTTVMM